MISRYGEGLEPAVTGIEAPKIGTGERRRSFTPTSSRPQFIRATLHGHDIAAACGFTARSPSPVLDLCRKFLAAGVPDQPLHAYRGDVLCVIVRSTGEGARLEVAEGIGFRQYRKASPASLAAPNAPARTRRRAGGGRRTGGADA
jgi:hypothetical protein